MLPVLNSWEQSAVPGELLLLTTILLASILASSNVVTSNDLTGGI